MFNPGSPPTDGRPTLAGSGSGTEMSPDPLDPPDPPEPPSRRRWSSVPAELESVVDVDANVLPIYDGTRIHAEAAADWIRGKE